MKPYIAILIDSFWEAVGNKVLWALLLGWSLILLGLAPFGYVSERSFQLSSADIDNRSQLLEKLSTAARGQGPGMAQAVVRTLDPAFQNRLRARAESDGRGGSSPLRASELARELNVALRDPGLYDEAAFPTAARRSRLEPLLAGPAERLSPADLEELNRELLQLAFPLELRRPRGEQLWIGYGGFKIGDPLKITRRQIDQFLEPILLGLIIKLGLGILAVFVALVVTSPIIPDTFRSGSLHLLLSKPISRVWLFLAKFFGGCIFVLLNITYVLIGLYLIAGLRFDIWNSGLLACIPLLMFVFVIFYSVSALVGLLFGNAIVCVVTCMVFWLFCFAIGFMHDATLQQVEVLPQLKRVRTLQGELWSVNERGEANVWNEQFAVWQPAIEPETRGQARTFGPIYVESEQTVILKSFFREAFGELRATSRKLALIRFDDRAENLEAGEGRASIEVQPNSADDARETPRWMSDQGPELPAQLFDVIEMGEEVMAICRGGLYRLDLEKLELIQATEKGFFGFKLPFGMPSAFENIAPPDYYLSSNTHAAATASGEGLVIYSSGSVDHLRLVGDRLKLVSNVRLEGDGTEAGLVQMNDNYCIVARDGLPLTVLNAALTPVAEIALPGDQQARQLAWVPESNRLSIVTHSGELLVLNCEERSLKSLGGSFAGQVTSVNWLTDQELWLGVKPNRAVHYQLGTQQVLADHTPVPTTFEWIFRWIIKPFYLVNPKPAALDNAMAYLLSGTQTQTLNLLTNDMEAAQLELDIWRPIISNLLFVIVILGIACTYVARKEF